MTLDNAASIRYCMGYSLALQARTSNLANGNAAPPHFIVVSYGPVSDQTQPASCGTFGAGKAIQQRPARMLYNKFSILEVLLRHASSCSRRAAGQSAGCQISRARFKGSEWQRPDGVQRNLADSRFVRLEARNHAKIISPRDPALYSRSHSFGPSAIGPCFATSSRPAANSRYRLSAIPWPKVEFTEDTA
ncbi:hypothetical protein KC359_g93 [Hortaea werneckii]|nr:hypothetical protein KC359_g93 [Hortaea werneckii]